MNGMFTATVDRVVDGETAVLLLEADGECLGQVTVPVDRLPEPTREDGGVLEVTVDEGSVVDATYCPDRTRNRRDAVEAKFDRLSSRLSDRDGE